MIEPAFVTSIILVIAVAGLLIVEILLRIREEQDKPKEPEPFRFDKWKNGDIDD